MENTLVKCYLVGLFDDVVRDLFGITDYTVDSYADAMTFRTNERIMTARRTRLAFLGFLLECEAFRDVDGNTVYRNDKGDMIRALARIAPRCPSADYICDKLSEVLR